jgi:predicted N-acetyltransferase YhbS
MTLVIRRASPEEADLVHAVMVNAFQIYRNASPPTSALSETVASIKKVLGSNEEAAICFDDGRAVGSVRFEKKNGLYFRRLAVLRSEQGRGIGSALVKWLEGEARLQGCDNIWLKVRANESGNISFYEKRGYSVIERKDEVNPDGAVIPIVVMRKALPSL